MTNGQIHQSYYENLLKTLKSEYKESICNENFTDITVRTEQTVTVEAVLGSDKSITTRRIKSGVFEIDLSFSTYYDNKIAHIIANELLYTYMLTKINPEKIPILFSY